MKKQNKICLLIYASLIFVTSLSWGQASLTRGSGTQAECEYSEEQKQEAEQKAISERKYVLEMSGKLYQFLDANQVKVAVVARAGDNMQDRHFMHPKNHPAGFSSHKYSHVGLAWKDPATGTYLFTHLLNTSNCGKATNQSQIFDQSLAYFFMDGLYYWDILVSVPSLELQNRLLRILEDKKIGKKGWAREMHLNRYSNISNPFQNRHPHQNSNQWALTTIAAAQSGALRREDAENFYRKNQFRASEVVLKFYELHFGPWFLGNFTTDDHSEEEKSSSVFKFVSAASIFLYLQKTDALLIDQKEICLGQKCNQVIKK